MFGTKIYFVYIIYNLLRRKIYIGFTSKLKTRILRHNRILSSKKKSYTSKNSGKWILIHKEEYSSLKDTMKREKWLKSGIGRKFIHNNLEQWIKSAQPADPPKADF